MIDQENGYERALIWWSTKSIEEKPLCVPAVALSTGEEKGRDGQAFTTHHNFALAS